MRKTRKTFAKFWEKVAVGLKKKGRSEKHGGIPGHDATRRFFLNSLSSPL